MIWNQERLILLVIDDIRRVGSYRGKLINSEVDVLKGAISIGNPNPINSGPMTFASPNVLISLYEIAALCCLALLKYLHFQLFLRRDKDPYIHHLEQHLAAYHHQIRN